MFTTNSVKAGDLLLCEKAFSHVYEPGQGADKAHTTLLLNLETDRGSLGGQADLIRSIAQNLYGNTSLAPSFTILHHGSYGPGNIFSRWKTHCGYVILFKHIVARYIGMH
jgi:hypothetical protein